MIIGSEVAKRLSSGTFIPSGTRVRLAPGDAVRHVRELQDLSQPELSRLTGIPVSVISGLEKKQIHLAVERAKTLARALRVHPAVLLFPGWDVEKESAA